MHLPRNKKIKCFKAATTKTRLWAKNRSIQQLEVANTKYIASLYNRGVGKVVGFVEKFSVGVAHTKCSRVSQTVTRRHELCMMYA